MRIGDAIYNLDGLPFRNEGKALRMCELLSGETGKGYRLEPYPEGGFVVRAAAIEQRYSKPEGQQPPLPKENPVPPDLGRSDTANTVPVASPKDYELRQAVFRTNLCPLFLMAVAVCFVLLPDSLLLNVLEVINIQPRQLGAWLQRLDQGMTGVGSAMLIVIWLSFLWQRAGALYRVTGFGVEARLGIIAHQTVGLRFQDIRSMGIKQSLLDRLLNVGLLEFTSAGTDGAPVRFNRVANPGKVLRIVKARMAGPGGSD
jgi:Bacterial PH domain